jgi:hypothetical protein
MCVYVCMHGWMDVYAFVCMCMFVCVCIEMLHVEVCVRLDVCM